MSEHLVEMAKALVGIKDGKIDVLTDPQIKHCPLRKDIYGFEEESRETITKIPAESAIRDLGMYGPARILEMEEKPVSFGASEILTDAIAERPVDAAVVVCEGAGSVVVKRPEVLQAVGAHMVGLLRTECVPEVRTGLVERGCLLLDESDKLKEQCVIDQVAGYQKALSVRIQEDCGHCCGWKGFRDQKAQGAW